MNHKSNRWMLALSTAFGLAIVGLTGCQTWGSGYPLNNPSRVPPPGTGTYQLPNGYYNGAAPTNGQISQMGPTNSTGVMPATTYTAGQPMGGVQSASFTAPASVPPAFAQPSQTAPNGQASQSFNDSDFNEAPSLQWQP